LDWYGKLNASERAAMDRCWACDAAPNSSVRRAAGELAGCNRLNPIIRLESMEKRYTSAARRKCARCGGA